MLHSVLLGVSVLCVREFMCALVLQSVYLFPFFFIDHMQEWFFMVLSGSLTG